MRLRGRPQDEDYCESIERMFAAVSDLYAREWHDFFHFAIFARPDQDWQDAFQQTHERYMAALRLDRARSVLDLACGRGAFTNLLAENTAGEVLGIDISRAQLSQCRRFRRPNLGFARHDVMRVGELAGEFDAISFLDAECYLPDKAEAMRQIGGVLAPGGRFLLIAWCQAEGLNPVQRELVLDPFMRCWGIPNLATAAAYRRYLAAAGLRLAEEQDLNADTRPNWEYGYHQAIAAIGRLSARDLPGLLWNGLSLGPEGIRLLKQQFAAALYIKAGFDAGFLRYTYFLCQRS